MLLGKSNFIRKALDRLEVKHKQYLLAFALGATVMGASFLVYLKITKAFNLGKAAASESTKPKVVETTRIESAVSRTDPQEIYRYKTEEAQEKLKNEIEEIKHALNEGMEYLAGKERDSDYSVLKSELNDLRNLVLNLSKNDSGSIKQEDFEGSEETSSELAIERVVFNLEERKAKTNKNIEENIPAGAFAKAVILGGVDASTTVSAPSDPRPMLIRLVDTGTLPRRFKSDLKDCHVVASSYGDLSSERVYARLEKLTCVERETGEIIETAVAGYIAGEDGRVGIRGNVVEKGQKYLTNSIAGGVLQGVASVLTPQQGMTLNPLGALYQQESNMDKFNRGFGTGVSSSMDRLSKYYIERAEKLQPVIQVGAGRVVDIVFTEGASIGTQLIKEKIEARRKANTNELEFESGE